MCALIEPKKKQKQKRYFIYYTMEYKRLYLRGQAFNIPMCVYTRNSVYNLCCLFVSISPCKLRSAQINFVKKKTKEFKGKVNFQDTFSSFVVRNANNNGISFATTTQKSEKYIRQLREYFAEKFHSNVLLFYI